jgi:hypothetical protein
MAVFGRRLLTGLEAIEAFARVDPVFRLPEEVALRSNGFVKLTGSVVVRM